MVERGLADGTHRSPPVGWWAHRKGVKSGSFLVQGEVSRTGELHDLGDSSSGTTPGQPVARRRLGQIAEFTATATAGGVSNQCTMTSLACTVPKLANDAPRSIKVTATDALGSDLHQLCRIRGVPWIRRAQCQSIPLVAQTKTRLLCDSRNVAHSPAFGVSAFMHRRRSPPWCADRHRDNRRDEVHVVFVGSQIAR